MSEPHVETNPFCSSRHQATSTRPSRTRRLYRHTCSTDRLTRYPVYQRRERQDSTTRVQSTRYVAHLRSASSRA